MDPVSRGRLEKEYERLLSGSAIPLREVLTAVVESGDGILLTDKDGRIRYANPAYERMSGYSESELIGKTPSIVSSGLYGKEFYADMWTELRKGVVVQKEFINRRKNGILYYQSEIISPVKDEAGAIIGFVSNGRDVTDERYREKKLGLVGKMSSLFLSEMREPLRHIQVPAVRLRKYAEKRGDKQVYEDLDLIYNTSREIEQMFDALHEFLRPTFTKDVKTGIEDALKHALYMVEPYFAGKGVTFAAVFEDPMPPAIIYERQWRFILAEMLHHYGLIAIGRSGIDSRVRISVRSLALNYVVTIEGGKGSPVGSEPQEDDLSGCMWVDGTDLKFLLMELTIADAKGIVRYEMADGRCRTTLIIPQNVDDQNR